MPMTSSESTIPSFDSEDPESLFCLFVPASAFGHLQLAWAFYPACWPSSYHISRLLIFRGTPPYGIFIRVRGTTDDRRRRTSGRPHQNSSFFRRAVLTFAIQILGLLSRLGRHRPVASVCRETWIRRQWRRSSRRRIPVLLPLLHRRWTLRGLDPSYRTDGQSKCYK